ncbi:hypothetical protein CRG98_037383 [Punica granatum]|uniref:Uncharacterized protein n=1 Tax=Punica granatum TaxID=22663 RepID=A0A2I0IEI9_PUNGR|nr:hypothetical protein CRG98_037383 [Punica granatum]
MVRMTDNDQLFPLLSSKKRKLQCQFMGAITTSFELPNDFGEIGIDLNKLKMPEAEDDLNYHDEKTRQFSFVERLQGWKIQCKARSTGKFDMYYYNARVRQMFRSIKEVVKFMMFEAYPKLRRTKNDYFKRTVIRHFNTNGGL